MSYTSSLFRKQAYGMANPSKATWDSNPQPYGLPASLTTTSHFNPHKGGWESNVDNLELHDGNYLSRSLGCRRVQWINEFLVFANMAFPLFAIVWQRTFVLLTHLNWLRCKLTSVTPMTYSRAHNILKQTTCRLMARLMCVKPLLRPFSMPYPHTTEALLEVANTWGHKSPPSEWPLFLQRSYRAAFVFS